MMFWWGYLHGYGLGKYSLPEIDRPNAISALNQTGNIYSIVSIQEKHLMKLIKKISKISENYALGVCAWRQTGECRWDGPRQRGNDKGRCVVISEGWSGYCECADGTKTMKKGCEKGAFISCKEACQDDGPCSKLVCRIIKNIHNHI